MWIIFNNTRKIVTVFRTVIPNVVRMRDRWGLSIFWWGIGTLGLIIAKTIRQFTKWGIRILEMHRWDMAQNGLGTTDLEYIYIYQNKNYNIYSILIPE